MTKDVLISLCAEQSGQGAGTFETAVPGLYYEKNGSRYILYDEVMEGFDKPVKTKVKFKEGIFEIIRSGVINVHMFFEEHKKNMTNYNTPYGNILLGISTKRIDILNRPDEIKIKVDYELEADYGHLADCSITMKIQSVVRN